jgi:hypothetical protein
MLNMSSHKMQLQQYATYVTQLSSKENSINENQVTVITKKTLYFSAVTHTQFSNSNMAQASNDEQKNTPINTPRSESPLKASRSESPLKPSRSESPLKPSRSGSPLNTSRSGSPLNNSRSESPLNTSRSGLPWTTSKSVIDLDMQIIDKIYQSKLAEIKNNNLEAIKISRYDYNSLKNTYIILKNGTILRGFHGSDKKGNRIVDKNEGVIGEGGLKIVNKLYNSHGKTSHVIAKLINSTRKDVIATNIAIAKEFHSTPHLLIGSYLEWKNKKGELKQGFITPYKDTDMLMLKGLPDNFTLLKGIRFFLHIAKGLKAMHDKNWIHLDIKPHNILLKNFKCYLTDFDCAVHLTDNSLIPLNGTIGFIAPEIINRTCMGIENGKKADIYSLGVTFYHIEQILRDHQDEHLGLDEDDIELAANLSALANIMCDEDPNVRPTIDDVMAQLKQFV